MKVITSSAESQRISPTHCPHGVLALARMGVRMVYTCSGVVCYQGTREAMVNAGVVDQDQLPGNGYVNTKTFKNCLGQFMRVTRQGKFGVTVRVRLSSIFAEREIDTDLDTSDYSRCLNRGLDLIRRIGQGAREAAA